MSPQGVEDPGFFAADACGDFAGRQTLLYVKVEQLVLGDRRQEHTVVPATRARADTGGTHAGDHQVGATTQLPAICMMERRSLR